MESNFNIFNLLGILIALIGLFTHKIIYVFIAIYISIITRIPKHIKEYKNTKKLKSYFIIDLGTFCIITLIFMAEIFSMYT